MLQYLSQKYHGLVQIASCSRQTGLPHISSVVSVLPPYFTPACRRGAYKHEPVKPGARTGAQRAHGGRVIAVARRGCRLGRRAPSLAVSWTQAASTAHCTREQLWCRVCGDVSMECPNVSMTCPKSLLAGPGGTKQHCPAPPAVGRTVRRSPVSGLSRSEQGDRWVGFVT